MEPTMTFHLEHDVAAGAGEVEAGLLDPELLARCVPGASLTAVSDGSVTGRIRIKQAPVPSVYVLRTELGRVQGDQPGATVLVAAGVAEEQRTSRSFQFRIRVALTPSGSGRTWCRITAELPAGDNTRALLERLMPQFVRRLEDVTLKLPEMSAAGSKTPALQELAQSPAVARGPGRWANARVIGAMAGVTAAAVFLVWSRLRYRRRGAIPF